ncbi:MAG: BlaI/MecI/CopY family transcriptional regulator [Verrucomicrobia bacterium]|nr:BlaI/MecI/CopY family transcriptional regulator [Verrucomicrobiota bacterium]
MSTPQPELTESEWAIIKAVWEHQPCAAPSVQEALVASRGWTYSTVRTLMDRMVAKGLLTAEKIRHLTLYRAAVSRRQAQLGELRYALRHAFDGALKPMVETLLTAETLSAADLDELEALIVARRKSQAGRPARKANP